MQSNYCAVEICMWEEAIEHRSQANVAVLAEVSGTLAYVGTARARLLLVCIRLIAARSIFHVFAPLSIVFTCIKEVFVMGKST